MNKNDLDIVWIIVSTALVFFMQGGFLLLETGLTRSKNNINVAMKNLSDISISIGLFWIFGYGLMYGDSYWGLLGGSRFFPGIFVDQNYWELSFFLYQAVFCGTAVTIISGAIAERSTFKCYMLIALMVSVFIYPVVGHWCWNGALVGESNGFLGKLGFIDFAGSTIVHGVGGWVALVACILIGPRAGRFSGKNSIFASSIPNAAAGVLILWFGWIGFNGGSLLAFNSSDVMKVITNTYLSSIFAAITTLLFSSFHGAGIPKTDSIINSILGGLVAITASCFYVGPLGAIIIGVLSSPIVLWSKKLFVYLRIDDAVDALPVHLACGVWGTLALGIFGDLSALGTGNSRLEQIGVQILGVFVVGLYSVTISYLFLSFLKKKGPLRVSENEEALGLNISEHDASTELFEFHKAMKEVKDENNLSLRIEEDPFSDMGQLISIFNNMMDDVELKETEREELYGRVQASIECASRIQRAFVPSDDYLNRCFKKNFCIWKPKDILSGDIYFCRYFDSGSLIVVIDATGHGVPGALMTMIAVSALNEIVGKVKPDEVGAILTSLNKTIKARLHRRSGKHKTSEGLDCAAVFVKEGDSSINYSGARIPLLIVDREGIKELRPDRESVGYADKNVDYQFTKHSMKISSSCRLFIFSDGVLDQPLRENRRSIGKKSLYNLLEETSSLSVESQKTRLLSSFDETCITEDQRDDITLIGIGLK